MADKKHIAVVRQATDCWGVYIGNSKVPTMIEPRKPSIGRFHYIVASGTRVSIEPITILRLPLPPKRKRG